MQRRAGSHTEEEELNQRRRLLNLARKGDPKAINRLFELYQVRIYTGEMLNKVGRLPFFPSIHQKPRKRTVRKRVTKRSSRVSRRVAMRKRARRRVVHR